HEHSQCVSGSAIATARDNDVDRQRIRWLEQCGAGVCVAGGGLDKNQSCVGGCARISICFWQLKCGVVAHRRRRGSPVLSGETAMKFACGGSVPRAARNTASRNFLRFFLHGQISSSSV